MSTSDTSRQATNNAPWLSIPKGQAISVEHPCIVQNVDKAIEMIGGPRAITDALQEGSERTFALSFRPGDPTARTIIANKKVSNNVLLQISVPKRTGRKRKRGSDEPWTEDPNAGPSSKNTTSMLRAMTDNPARYRVTALSGISSMHIWRSMPDFAYSTTNLKVLDDIKSKILSQHYPSLKEFQLPQTYGLEDTTTIPPPTWSNQSIPQNYSYRQNPSMKAVSDPTTGQRVLKNTQAAPKIYSHQVQWDTPEYPVAIMPNLPPLGEQSRMFRETTAAIDTLFQVRPIWTRRALLNELESRLSSFNVVRFCLAYVAYAIRSGPWRDTYVRIGVDPRMDTKYRFYQSIMLQLQPKVFHLTGAGGALRKEADQAKDPNPVGHVKPIRGGKDKVLEDRQAYARFWSRSTNTKSHIFDGVSPLPPDGKVWQLCDITDPQLAALRDLPDIHIRADCERRYFGWYANGTNAKMRVALKAKVDALMNGTPLGPEALEGFLQLPERVGYDQSRPADGKYNSGDTLEVPDALDQSSTTEITTHPQARVSNSNLNRSEALSVYLGEDATKQQLEWAALYRAFARTEPGHKPVTGGWGSGRLTKSKPDFRKSYRGKEMAPVQAPEQEAGVGQSQNADDASSALHIQPIDVDQGETLVGVEGQSFELEDGEEVLPSIEFNGFDVEDDNDSELGLDLDPEIKLEVEDEQATNV